jgi:hypothetical protein
MSNPAVYQLGDNFDPPSDPFKDMDEEEEEEWSNCCGAKPLLPTHDGMGICSYCKENAVFDEVNDD